VRLVLLCLAIALNFTGFFLYIASAPAFIYNLLKLTETDFAVLFVPGIAGVMIGAFVSGRAAGKLSPQRTVGVGYLVMFASVAFNVGYHAFFPPALPWSVLPIMCYTIGMALVMPSVTLIILDLFPENRGLASSLQGFTHSFFAAMTAGLVSPLLSGLALTLALGMAALLTLGWLSWMTYRYIETRSPAHE